MNIKKSSYLVFPLVFSIFLTFLIKPAFANTYTAGNGLTLNGSIFGFGGVLSNDSRIYRSGNTSPSNEVMFLKSSNGSVGFGTASPSAKLEISSFGVGGTGVTSQIPFKINQLGKYLTIDNTYGSAFYFSTNATSGFSFNQGVYAGFNNVFLSKSTGNSYINSGNFSLYTGKFGVGTASPTQKIDVVGGGIRLTNNNVAKPACTQAARGTMWFTAGVGTSKDSFQICVQGSGSTAASWVTLY